MEDIRFRAYITDAVKVVTENTSRYIVPGVGAVEHGSKMSGRWYIPHGSEPEPEEPEPDGDEIVLQVMQRAGLTFERKGDALSD